METDVDIERKKLRSDIIQHMELNETNETFKLIEEYENLWGRDVKIQSLKGLVHVNMGNFDEAEKAFNEGLLIDSEDIYLNFNLGYLYIIKKDYENALNYLKKSYEKAEPGEFRHDLKDLIENVLPARQSGRSLEKPVNDSFENNGYKGKRCLILCSFYSVYVKEFIEKLSNDNDIQFDILTIETYKYKSSTCSNFINKLYEYYTIQELFESINSIPKYDIIHIHFLSSFYGYISDAIRKKCKKLVVSIWGSDFYRTSNGEKELQRKVLEKADVITIDNEVTMEEFIKYYGEEYRNKICICRFGLTALEYINEIEAMDKNAVKKELDIPEDSIVVTCGYNANPAHNHLDIIKSITEEINSLPENMYFIFPMTYARQEDYVDNVKEALAKSKLNYRVLDDFMNFKEIARYTKATDIMIQLQITDTMSATMQEHMYSGNIIITGSWLPYQPLKDAGVYFIDIPSVDKVGEKLLEVIDNINIQRKLCFNNKKAIWDFSSWENTMKQWLSVYKINKKVIIAAYYFPPLGGAGVQRTLKYVKYLREFGWEPVVITSGESSSYVKDESLLSEVPDDINIIRIDDITPEEIKQGFLENLLKMYEEIVANEKVFSEYLRELKNNRDNLEKMLLVPDYYSSWVLKVLNELEKINLDDIDVIYTTSSPYSTHFIGYFLKKKYNKPWVADFRDEWTNNPYTKYDLSSIDYKIQRSMEENIVNKADKIITVTDTAVDNYINIFDLNSKKVECITNGYDEGDFDGIDFIDNKNNKFNIIHNGFLYYPRTPETLLQAVSMLVHKGLISKDKIKIYFTRVAEEIDLFNLVKKYDLDENVEYLGYLNHKESLIKSNQMDLLLIIIGSGEKCKEIATGKLYEYLRLNKPILSLAPEDGCAARIINETERGYSVDYNDIEKIGEYFLKLYRDWENNSQTTYFVDEKIKKYERRKLTGRLVEIFDSLI